MTAKTMIVRLARRLARRGRPGYIDHFDARRVSGWAFDPSDPATPALLSLHVDGQPELNIIADMKREDVQAAGLGPLRSGFDTTLPRRLRDGKAHQVEIRLGLDGPLLRGGTLSIPADPRRTGGSDIMDEDQEAETDGRNGEGVAFFDPAHGAITGWAKGCTQVTVRLDGGTGQVVRLEREVPGFGTGSLQGFRLAVPAEMRDGRPHRAEVVFDRAGAQLDGSPLSFTLGAERIFVEGAVLKGTDLTLTLRDSDGRPATAEGLVLLADGLPLETGAGTVAGRIEARLPADCRGLVLRNARGEMLARYAVSGNEALPDPRRELPAEALDAAGLQRARTAFEAFLADPGDRFDPVWYRWACRDAQGLETADALLGHYRDHAGIAAASPGSFFDEAAARAFYPAIADAVAAGDLPCAFALDLALGEGSLETLAGLTHEQRRVLARRDGPPPRARLLEEITARPGAPILPEPLIARQPAPVAAQAASDTVYAAWFARLSMTPDQRAELERDEHRMRRGIASAALTRAPLVTVIMPSWNRAFTIGEAIQSLIEQTYANWELIVCDDASTDRTADVVRGFDDPRIRYMKFLKSNGAGARNKGMGWARGEYIAYLDSDNIWHPQFLDMMIRRLLAAPGSAIAYAAYLDTEMVGGRVELLDVPRPAFRPVQLNSRNFMDLNSIVHHRRIYDWMGGFDNALPRLQDWDLALRYTSVFRPIFVNHVGVFYRRNVAWGQVTHLFMDSGARETVGEKTRRRLEGAHERLDIPWPERGRITILSGGTDLSPADGNRVLAENLARLAAGVTDVDLVELGGAGDEAGDDLPGLTRHPIPADLARDLPRLGRVLGTLLQGRPVLSVGLGDAQLRAMSGLHPDQVWRLHNDIEGTVLQALAGPTRFGIGAIPLALPPAEDKGSVMLALLPPLMRRSEREALRQDLADEAQKRGVTLLVAGEEGIWRVQDRSGWQAAEMDPRTGLPVLIGQCAVTICPGAVSGLDPFGFALLNALQARGVPAAVPPEPDEAQDMGFAGQWIEAGAAYEIKMDDLKWLFDKLRKLLSAGEGLARLQERSRLVHAIALHPDLARERLGHALYRLLHEPPHREVIDGR
ncbi:glycosyltransferase family 2 protein [Paracoccus fontiphilus]|uniref:Glycosyltransferase family 2 protein n=1 Tax=Paracoccus fontiphilus TaxID=1815556 RepID=A0ABV7ILJ0_9RHOB|nr:glycosyltransferase family A protein [Paracoccus fontiphilus]